jgi:CO/xanthine dehydrogenase Mo-binding subunit
MDIPEKVKPLFVETPQLDGPFGARGVAEHPMISVNSAIGNAVYDALGIDIMDLPITSERVWRAIQDKKTVGS